MSRPVLGIDVGGTKLLGCAVDESHPGTPLLDHRTATPQGPDALVDGLAELAGTLQRRLAAEGHGSAAALGIGMPGLVDLDGIPQFAPHIPGITGLPLAELLSERLELPVTVDNDANCAAVAEARFGVAEGRNDALLITLGTGIGGGIISAGRLVRGAHGLAGEPGHMVVAPHGEACPCGRRGCWERYASGTGLALLGRSAVVAGRAPDIAARAGRAETVRGEHVVAAAAAGGQGGLAVMDELGWWIALGLANLVNLLDPEIIVLGGGLVDAGEVLMRPVRSAFSELARGGSPRPVPPVEVARLGSSAGAIGAAVLSLHGP